MTTGMQALLMAYSEKKERKKKKITKSTQDKQPLTNNA